MKVLLVFGLVAMGIAPISGGVMAQSATAAAGSLQHSKPGLTVGSADTPAERSTDSSAQFRDQFGIPNSLSDCDIPDHPVTEGMDQLLREIYQTINSTNRDSCRMKWQSHESEVQVDQMRVEAARLNAESARLMAARAKHDPAIP